MNIDQKWEVVKTYYEKNYKTQFKERLPDDKIEFLFRELSRLNFSIQSYLAKHQTTIRAFIERSPVDRDSGR